MGTPRRKCKLADSKFSNIDLRNYKQLIIDTINTTVPNKNPQVFKDYYSTDVLNQSESVLIGRALAKLDELKVYGKQVTIFRLFDGKVYNSESSNIPVKNIKPKIKGGRMS